MFGCLLPGVDSRWRLPDRDRDELAGRLDPLHLPR
jgi:hypothetical protein